MLSIGILFGLLAMFAWGIGNFLETTVIKKLGTIKTMFGIHFLNFIVLGPIAAYLFVAGIAQIDMVSLAILIVFSIIQVGGVYFMMKGIEVGEVSIVAPISASSSVVTVILAVLILSEQLTQLRISGIILSVIGVILISSDFSKIKKAKNTKGVKEALLSMLGFGVFLFAVGYISRSLTLISLIAATRLVVSSLLTLFATVKKGKISITEYAQFKWYFVAMFFAFNMGFFAYQVAVHQDLVSIATPVSSLNPAVTIILAAVFLKERLLANQKAGVVLALLGIFLLGI